MLLTLQQAIHVRWQRHPREARLDHRLGKLGRVGRGQGDHWRCGIRPYALGGAIARRGVGVEQLLGALMRLANHVENRGVIHAVAGEQLAQLGQRRFGQCRRLALETLKQRRNSRPITLVSLKQQTLEVGRHHDIHGGRQRCLQRLLGKVVVGQRAVQNIVGVGGDDELLDRQPHAVSHVTRKDVAEVGRRHAEADLAVWCAQRHPRRHVVDDLGHDTRPVDRVDRHQACTLQKGLIGKTRLEHRLGIIEVALNGDIKDIIGLHGGHLAPLDLGDAVVRMQNKNIEVVAVATPLDGRRAGVAGGGAHDHRPLTTLGQEMVEDTAQQLQRDILEGQGWTVKHFEQEVVGIELVERHHGIVAEGGVSVAHQTTEGVVINLAIDEGLHHTESDLGIRQPGHGREFVTRKLRDLLRHVETTIAGQASEHHLFE